MKSRKKQHHDERVVQTQTRQLPVGVALAVAAALARQRSVVEGEVVEVVAVAHADGHLPVVRVVTIVLLGSVLGQQIAEFLVAIRVLRITRHKKAKTMMAFRSIAISPLLIPMTVDLYHASSNNRLIAIN